MMRKRVRDDRMRRGKGSGRGTATIPLESDVVALLAAVADELATVDDHAGQANPEVLVGDHLTNGLGTVNLPVNDHTNSNVENDSSEKPVFTKYTRQET